MIYKSPEKVYLLVASLCLGILFTGLHEADHRIWITDVGNQFIQEDALFTNKIEEAMSGPMLELQKKRNVTYAYVGDEWVDVLTSPHRDSGTVVCIPYSQPVAKIQAQFGWTEIWTRQGERGWVRQESLVESMSAETRTLVSSRYNQRANALKGLVETAKEQLGKPYVWGAVGPSTFDCSGFVQYVYKQHGIQMPRVSADQALVGRKVLMEELAPGDLVFFDTRGDVNGNVSHVGIYLGNNEFIHASSGRAAMCVTISSFESDYYKGRFLFGRSVF